MKWLSSFFAVTMLITSQPVEAATTDPMRNIYRVSGVRDNGGGVNSGVATSFHCTNFGPVTEKIKFIVRDKHGSVVGGRTVNVDSNETFTASTHHTLVFVEDAVFVSLLVINQGSAVI